MKRCETLRMVAHMGGWSCARTAHVAPGTVVASSQRDGEMAVAQAASTRARALQLAASTAAGGEHTRVAAITQSTRQPGQSVYGASCAVVESIYAAGRSATGACAAAGLCARCRKWDPLGHVHVCCAAGHYLSQLQAPVHTCSVARAHCSLLADSLPVLADPPRPPPRADFSTKDNVGSSLPMAVMAVVALIVLAAAAYFSGLLTSKR